MFRRPALLLLCVSVLGLGCLGGTPMENDVRPWEGTWRLVRVDGGALPFRRDTLEILAERVTFLQTGSGFLTDSVRVHRDGSTAVARGCASWYGFTVNGDALTLSPVSTPTPPQAGCPLNLVDRRFVLAGDTLRATGGNGFAITGVTRVYVR